MTAGRHVDDSRPADADQPGTAEPDSAEQPDNAERAQSRSVDDSPVLPTRSSDDLDTGWGDRPRGDDDERFLRDVPPHWGR